MVRPSCTTSGVVKRSRPCPLLSFQLGIPTHRMRLVAGVGVCNRYADDTLGYWTSLTNIALQECMHMRVYKQVEERYHYDSHYNATWHPYKLNVHAINVFIGVCFATCCDPITCANAWHISFFQHVIVPCWSRVIQGNMDANLDIAFLLSFGQFLLRTCRS